MLSHNQAEKIRALEKLLGGDDDEMVDREMVEMQV